MKISGIYKIQSKIKPERCYIGSGVNIYNRWKEHRSLLNLNKHHSKKLQNHYSKYGLTDLKFTILLGCEKESLITNEQFFIDSINPYFNISKTAGSTLGLRWKVSPERLIQIKAMNKGRVHSKEIRLKMSMAMKGRPSPMKGKKTPEEIKEKQRKSHKGCKGWNKGLKASPLTRLRLSESHLGKKRPPFTEETKQKMRKPKSIEHRMNISKAKKGIKLSDKTRQILSESAKRRCERQRLLKQIS